MTTASERATSATPISPEHRRGALTHELTKAALVLAGIAALAAAPYYVSGYSLDILTLGLAYGLMAMALAVLVGYVGLPSLGHAAFVGIGSYAAGLMAVHVTDHAVVGLVVAAAVGGVAALFIGLLSLRSQGVFFLMMTLAFAEIIHQISIQSSFTGGDNGLSVPPPHIPVLDGLGQAQVVVMYWYVLVVLALGYLLLRWFVRSPLGDAFHGVRENSQRMASAGYSVVGIRLRAVVLSGAVTAVGGALLVQKDTLVAPTALTPSVSVLLLVMVLVGGSTSLVGPLLGAVLLVYLRSATSSWLGESWALVEGLIFVVVVLFFPTGIAGGMQRLRRAAPRGSESP